MTQTERTHFAGVFGKMHWVWAKSVMLFASADRTVCNIACQFLQDVGKRGESKVFTVQVAWNKISSAVIAELYVPKQCKEPSQHLLV